MFHSLIWSHQSDYFWHFDSAIFLNYVIILLCVGGGRNGPSKITGFQPAVGRGGGLGYESGGRPAIKAMTSSMLAASSGVKSSGSGSGSGSGSSSSSSSGSGVQMTFSKAMGVASKSVGGSTVPASGGVIPGNTAANPYIEGQGMGRGKHLTTPSWSDGTDVPPPLSSASASSSSSLSSVSASSSSSLRAVVPQQFNDATDNTTVALPAALNNFLHERKRNRFSAIGSAPAPPAPTMAGFIRAAVTGNSFLAGNNTVSTTLTVEKTDIAEKLGADVVVQKKSRWDK